PVELARPLPQGQRRSRVVPRIPSPRRRPRLRAGRIRCADEADGQKDNSRDGSMFEPVAARYDGPVLEKDILDLWKREDVFRRVLDATKDRPRFVFYEGP